MPEITKPFDFNYYSAAPWLGTQMSIPTSPLQFGPVFFLIAFQYPYMKHLKYNQPTQSGYAIAEDIII